MFRVLATSVIVAGFSGFVAARQDAKMKFELYKGKDDQFRWRLKAANGAVLATAGQGYKAAADARHGIEILQKAGTDEKLKFEVYDDEKKEHRWRLKAANGEKASASIKADAAKTEVVEVKE
jgi:uncharacterized protein YegP (UPF0339 family)